MKTGLHPRMAFKAFSASLESLVMTTRFYIKANPCTSIPFLNSPLPPSKDSHVITFCVLHIFINVFKLRACFTDSLNPPAL